MHRPASFANVMSELTKIIEEYSGYGLRGEEMDDISLESVINAEENVSLEIVISDEHR